MLIFKRNYSPEYPAFTGMNVNLTIEVETDWVHVHHPDAFSNNTLLGFEEYPKLAEYLNQKGEYNAMIHQVSKKELIINVIIKNEELYDSILLPIHKVELPSRKAKIIEIIIIILVIIILIIIKG